MSEDQKLTKKDSNQSEKPNHPKIGYFKLYRYADGKDYVMMFFGGISALANGAAFPLFSLIFGDMANSFNPANGPDAIVDLAGKYSLYFLYAGIGSWFASYISFACWMISGERQTIKYRKEYFRALLRQEIGWYDALNPNELSTRVASECQNIQGGLGEKVATLIFTISMVLAGFLVGYIKGWQLALVLTSAIPIMLIAATLFVFSLQKSTQKTSEAYAESGAIAEQALNAIRTVQALGGEEKEATAYETALEVTKKFVSKFGLFSGFAFGLIFFALSGMYALGFYYGSVLVGDQTYNSISGVAYNTGDVLTIFFAVLTGGFSLAQISPCLKAFALARESGTKALEVIDRKSKISVEDASGLKPESITGNIKFENIHFAYPIREEKKILKGVTFMIEPNKKTAFVGESGCGKTTCMQLIERFYDVNDGSLSLDGNDIRKLNLRWLRENIGYVGQEPALFATSIRENLKFAKEDATEEDMLNALRQANAHEFVMHLPNKLDTFVGTSGAQLSGGQKQRLAIARAILKNPRILLLDEATSALDRKNELEIQQTLDKISEGRTTIVIAHRLQTIINSDKIIVFDEGYAVEEGTHKELIAKKGRYYNLQQKQLAHHEQQHLDDGYLSNRMIPDERHNNALAPVVDEGININVKKVSREPSKQDIVQIDLQKSGNIGQANENERLIPDKKKTDVKQSDGSFTRLLTYNKPEMNYLFLGIIVALINGAIFPCFAILLASILDVLSKPNASNFRKDSDFISLMFLVCAIGMLIFNTLQLGIFTYVGECLTLRVRCDVFRKFMKMHIGWFDKPENSPGTLATKLASDAALVNSLTSSILGISLQSLSSFITGMVIAFTASWQLTLVTLAVSPLMIFSGQIQAKFNQGFSSESGNAYKDAGGFIAEIVTNMRTVASFGKENELIEVFSRSLEKPLKTANKRGHISGAAFGLSNLSMFGTYAIVFYIGALFTRDLGLSFRDMFMSIFGIMFAAFGSGNASQFMPDAGAAKNAAKSIFTILDTKPEIDIDDPNQTVRTPIKGNIEFKNVKFTYPARDKEIFNDLNFKANASQKVALVGPSGCGKSTCIQLLLRFYDPLEGQILVDGVDIRNYDLRHLRSSIGLVSQEPILFNGTIEYNLKYARPDATVEEIRAAAAQANALEFIEKNEFDVIERNEKEGGFGSGFHRKVGPKGSQISGGQKQRIAIARAILKNPTILLLDEATSALDAQNEEIVQNSLNQIMTGHTCLTIAHRISTIKDSDEILVFSEGNIVERGKYSDLVKAQGVFYKLERGLG